MKTRATDAESKTGLPPPPAPTSRDANPWPMSTPSKGGQPAGKQHVPRHPRAPGWPPAPQSTEGATHQREQRVRWVPLMILVFIAGTGVQLAIKALWSGDVEAAVVALVIVAMAAFVLVRRVTRKK